MSEFAVYRTLGNGRCLVLDGTRIAGGKPDYRGNNYITSWVTDKTYGPVDELKSENAKLREEIEAAKHDLQVFSMSSVQLDADNAKLRELVRKMWKPFCWAQSGYDVCLPDDEDREIRDLARELGIEVD